MTAPSLDLNRLQGLMFDLDGVLFVGDGVVPGAVEAIASLAARGLRLRFVTNTTAEPRDSLLAKLRGLGFTLDDQQLFTPAALARRVLERTAGQGGPRYRLLGAPALAADLGPGRLALDDPGVPDWVVLGVHPPHFQHATLSRALNDLLDGARLLALHRSRMWKTPRGLELGLGGYMRALEYAARTEALVIGKPSADFFGEVLGDLGLPRDRVAMVGDDVEGDVGGAQAAGVAGVLVRTGKFREDVLARSGVTPALIVDDVGQLARQIAAT